MTKNPNSKKKEPKKEYEPDIEIEEDIYGVGGYGKDKTSYKSIVMEQYRKCCEEGSREMSSGGVLKRLIDGEVVEIMALDQIEIYSNCVGTLKSTLVPSINKHKKIIKERMDTVEKKVIENDIKRREAYKRLNGWYRKKSNIINPEGVSESQNYYKDYVQMNKQIQKIHQHHKLEIHKELFEVLGILLSHMNYLDEVGGTGF